MVVVFSCLKCEQVTKVFITWPEVNNVIIIVYFSIKKLRPRPFRPLVIVQDNATEFDVNDLQPVYRKGWFTFSTQAWHTFSSINR